VEDVGLARADAPVLVMALFAAHQHFEYPEHDRLLILLHAARALATGPKDRSTDELANWAKLTADEDGVVPGTPTMRSTCTPAQYHRTSNGRKQARLSASPTDMQTA